MTESWPPQDTRHPGKVLNTSGLFPRLHEGHATMLSIFKLEIKIFCTARTRKIIIFIYLAPQLIPGISDIILQSVAIMVPKVEVLAIRHTFNLSISSYMEDTSRIHIRYAQSQKPSGKLTFPSPFRRLFPRSDPPLGTLGYPSRTSPQPTEEEIYGFYELDHLAGYKTDSLPSTNEMGACEVFD